MMTIVDLTTQSVCVWCRCWSTNFQNPTQLLHHRLLKVRSRLHELHLCPSVVRWQNRRTSTHHRTRLYLRKALWTRGKINFRMNSRGPALWTNDTLSRPRRRRTRQISIRQRLSSLRKGDRIKRARQMWTRPRRSETSRGRGRPTTWRTSSTTCLAGFTTTWMLLGIREWWRRGSRAGEMNRNK